MGKKKGGVTQTSTKDLYDQSRYIRNRTRTLTKHLKKFPNDEAAKAALKNVVNYRRCKPKSHKKVWTAEKRWYAQILAEVGGNGKDALLVKKSKTQGSGE